MVLDLVRHQGLQECRADRQVLELVLDLVRHHGLHQSTSAGRGAGAGHGAAPGSPGWPTGEPGVRPFWCWGPPCSCWWRGWPVSWCGGRRRPGKGSTATDQGLQVLVLVQGGGQVLDLVRRQGLQGWPPGGPGERPCWCWGPVSWCGGRRRPGKGSTATGWGGEEMATRYTPGGEGGEAGAEGGGA